MWALLGNVIYLSTGGIITAFLYTLMAIVFFPLLPFLIPFLKYVWWPLGNEIVTYGEINAYKLEHKLPIEENMFDKASPVVRFIANVIWILFPGFILAICHIIFGLIALSSCTLLVTIPFALPAALANFKLVPIAFAPFGVKVINHELAAEIKKSAEKASL